MHRIVAAFLVTATPVLALSELPIAFVSKDGTGFYQSTTADGEIFIAPADNPRVPYVLTPNCVAENTVYGTGSWGYEEGGWQISFGLRHEIYFPAQTPPIHPSDCQMLR